MYTECQLAFCRKSIIVVSIRLLLDKNCTHIIIPSVTLESPSRDPPISLSFGSTIKTCKIEAIIRDREDSAR